MNVDDISNGPLNDAIDIIIKRNEKWRQDKRQIDILRRENAGLRERVSLQQEVLEEKLTIIDTLTNSLDSVLKFDGPHSAPSFVKSLAVASSSPQRETGGPRIISAVVPAHHRSELETIRRLQSQCVLQMEQINQITRERNNILHSARSLAAKTISRHLVKWHRRNILHRTISTWCAGPLHGEGKK